MKNCQIPSLSSFFTPAGSAFAHICVKTQISLLSYVMHEDWLDNLHIYGAFKVCNRVKAVRIFPQPAPAVKEGRDRRCKNILHSAMSMTVLVRP